MKKLASLVVVILLVLVVIPNEFVEGEPAAIYLKGHAYDSYDGNAVWNRHSIYSGNITAIDVNQPGISPRGANDAINDGSVNQGDENQFWWDAAPGEEAHRWYKYAPEPGNNIIFLGEYQHHDKYHEEFMNYTWASNYIAEEKGTPPDIKEHAVRYEPIPRPVLNPYTDEARGLTWVNISIPNFKYTSSTIEGKPTDRGTYDLLQSYAVFIKDEFEGWRYLGNSEVDPNNKKYLDDPLPAADHVTDPSKINTGSHYFLVEDLKPSMYYEFKVRVNFRTLEGPVEPVWGYQGGLGDEEMKSGDLFKPQGGSVTTFAGGEVSTIPTSSVQENLATYLQGDPRDSYDGNAGWYDEQYGFSGNITAININNPDKTPRGADDAINDGTVNEGKDTFFWDATPGDAPHQWFSSPEFGQNIMFLAEYQYYDEKYDEYINYTWVSNYKAESESTPPNIGEHVVKYEPIPEPVVNPYSDGDAVGPSWINISIPNFKYTSSTIEGEPTERGTYDLLHSYAVFIRQEGKKEWTYLGNSQVDPKNSEGLDPPILPIDDQTDPGEINTGSHYFLADGLEPKTGYEFKVRVNFRTLDEPVHGKVWGWGYEGGGQEKEEKGINPFNDDILGLGGGTITPFGSRKGGVFPTGDAYPPSEPRELTATGDTDEVYLEWIPPSFDGGSPVTNYKIYRNTTYGTYEHYDTVTAPDTDYSDIDVAAGVEYKYHVTAVNMVGEGPNSNTASAVPLGTPTAPLNLEAQGGEDHIELEWDPPINDGGSPITEYWIYREGSYHGHVVAPITSYIDDTVDSGVDYSYQVRARNSVGFGPYSDQASAASYTTYDIPLSYSPSSNGWSFISPLLIPEDNDMETILNDPTYGISGSYDRVMYFDSTSDTWKSYVPGRASHFNTLTEWDETMGVWIRMTGNDVLTIVGVEPTTTSITLNPGWNMVGYPSLITGNNGLPSEVAIIGVFNDSEDYNVEYIYSTGDHEFEPGNAYWLFNEEGYSVDWLIQY